MLQQTLKSLFNRDLNKLKAELELYQTESNIWLVSEGIANPAGNMVLHLVGNLNAFIGAQLGNTGYIRNRPLEFSLRDIPRSELIQKIEDTIVVVSTVMDTLTDEQLTSEYPVLVLETKTTTEYFLVHLATHLAYHLGQVNYHRRLLDK
jgi:hypothetical protein